jgi:hypothetical protein
VTSAPELAAAIAEAARHQPIRLPLEWYFGPSSLRAVPSTRRPTEVLGTADTKNSPPVPVPAAVVAPVAVQRHPEADLVPVWWARLDVSIWRTRRFLWRLAAKMVVRRLRR